MDAAESDKTLDELMLEGEAEQRAELAKNKKAMEDRRSRLEVLRKERRCRLANIDPRTFERMLCGQWVTGEFAAVYDAPEDMLFDGQWFRRDDYWSYACWVLHEEFEPVEQGARPPQLWGEMKVRKVTYGEILGD